MLARLCVARPSVRPPSGQWGGVRQGRPEVGLVPGGGEESARRASAAAAPLDGPEGQAAGPPGQDVVGGRLLWRREPLAAAVASHLGIVVGLTEPVLVSRLQKEHDGDREEGDQACQQPAEAGSQYVFIDR